MKRSDLINTANIYAIAISAVAFVYRIFGIFNNHPFWVDEFSTAKNARYMLQYGLDLFNIQTINPEKHNITTHALTALSFHVFGMTEGAARLPFVVIGSLLPMTVFFLTRRLTNSATAICASLFTLFSYTMITWSRQARGYVILNFAILWTMYFYLGLLEKKGLNKKNIIGLSIFTLIGFLTHPLYYLIVAAIGVHWIITQRKTVFKVFKNKASYYILVPAAGVLLAVLHIQDSLRFFTTTLFGADNWWYYHSYLWRENTLITFLGFLGLITLFFKHRNGAMLILLYTALHWIFINYMFGHYLTKYLLPIFPLLLIGMAVAIYEFIELTIKTHLPKVGFKSILIATLPIALSLFVISNGDKFVKKPVPYYSVNKDFREIANIDYHQVYEIIESKGRLKDAMTAVIDTWPDRAKWYVGNGYPALYFFKWQNDSGRVSGHVKQTKFTLENGEKITVGRERFKFIGEAADLMRVIKKYPRGFLYIDDTTLPKDVIDFAEKNLKKELYLEHYPLDENPYSIWPATLYSWGV
jgi:hypothetical protein